MVKSLRWQGEIEVLARRQGESDRSARGLRWRRVAMILRVSAQQSIPRWLASELRLVRAWVALVAEFRCSRVEVLPRQPVQSRMEDRRRSFSQC